MDYKIVIPSYKRVNILLDKTLNLLINYKIDLSKVYVFVVEEEELLYKQQLPAVVNVVKGVKGISAQRDFISNYFDDGQPLVSLDDDITNLLTLSPCKSKTDILDNFEELIYSTFLTLKMSNLRLAGLYPVNNYYFLKDKITTDLRFIIGQVKIYFNTPICEKRDFYLLEDFETTLKYYLFSGGVLRINNICIDANINSFSKVYKLL